MKLRLWLLLALGVASLVYGLRNLKGLNNRIDKIDGLTNAMHEFTARPQYIRILGAPEEDRALLVYRAPGESVEDWVARARRRAVGEIALDEEGRVEEKTTTVTWNGITFQIVTTRGTQPNGNPEDKDEWCKRHEEAVEAWQAKHR